ncbi:hypothetical protein L2U69_02635 [Zavarzinia compransoris]|uniref:hypothetical protein n=1 Tax=Zavarzinia marina TaxID=2911065 RepID=UPI001F354594|nr:hypothetical protein [Zavarzinia marina]MCF4164544.1 hypothetical protein [Zavarzinia marina]
MTSFVPKILPAIALALLGGACALTPMVITHEYLAEDFYRPGAINAAVVDGGVPTVVVGAPFPDVGPEAALAPLKPPSSVAADHLSPAPEGAGGTRLVLLFHPARPASSGEMCGPTPPLAALAGPAGGEGLSVQAILCRGSTQLSSALGRGPAPAGTGDPAYADMVQQLLLVVMPLTVPIDLPLL